MSQTKQYDYDKLNKELDWVKSRVFIGRGNSAFLAPLMCSMNFRWMEDIGTAQTDGTYVGWDPEFFISLLPETRETVLVHELWHPALLHMVRRGDRDPEQWNWACDIRINNDLKAAGFSFKGIEWAWLDPSFDENGRMAEEEIYDIIYKKRLKPPRSGPGNANQDMEEPSDEKIQTVVNSVIRAVAQHELQHGAGSSPLSVRDVLGKFLAPVVPWEKELMEFCTDLIDHHLTWARPNRRYTDVYLPSWEDDDGRLDHLAYFVDVSGSCSNQDVLRFNSEIKYIKETLKPRKLTVCQFTTVIMHETVFEEDDPFDEIIRHGTGGTSFSDVRRRLQEIKPTAAVVFSDMDCPPMRKLDYDIPILWVAVRAAGAKVPEMGRMIHIRG